MLAHLKAFNKRALKNSENFKRVFIKVEISALVTWLRMDRAVLSTPPHCSSKLSQALVGARLATQPLFKINHIRLLERSRPSVAGKYHRRLLGHEHFGFGWWASSCKEIVEVKHSSMGSFKQKLDYHGRSHTTTVSI